MVHNTAWFHWVYIDVVVELCTDPQVIIYQYYFLLVNLFDLIDLYWNAIEYDGIIKYFVLIMQGINHIGDPEWVPKMCGKLLNHLLEIKVFNLLNKSLETWVDKLAQSLKNWCPEHKQKTLLSWKHPCVTIGTPFGALSILLKFVERFSKSAWSIQHSGSPCFGISIRSCPMSNHLEWLVKYMSVWANLWFFLGVGYSCMW